MAVFVVKTICICHIVFFSTQLENYYVEVMHSASALMLQFPLEIGACCRSGTACFHTASLTKEISMV